MLWSLRRRRTKLGSWYTDAGYLVDYANYYARCHEEYQRTTTRLHFFSSEPKPSSP
jgi:hypothetical protein